LRPLRIAQAVPPIETVPPEGYGGTERVVYELVTELIRRGHDVTTFASADSAVPGRLIPTIDEALRPTGHGGDISGYMLTTMLQVLDREAEFDLIHSHLEWYSLVLRRAANRPIVATFHGRLDLPWSRNAFAGRPDGMVAISESQASVHPDVPWNIVHNGLTLDAAPFERRRSDALVFVGRVTPEKGIVEAIEIAKRAGRPLKIAAKIGPTPTEQAFNDEVFQPALDDAGSLVEFLGELGGDARDALFATSHAVLMPGLWPEPFGLVAIESMATGTPVIARRAGALTETIDHGETGFLVDDEKEAALAIKYVRQLNRRAVRKRTINRFSPQRMADEYEAAYANLLGIPVEKSTDEPAEATVKA
jgi:glycosyltransferase involved in cell wall biosynthesis